MQGTGVSVPCAGAQLLLRKAGNGVYCDRDLEPGNQEVRELESVKVT